MLTGNWEVKYEKFDSEHRISLIVRITFGNKWKWFVEKWHDANYSLFSEVEFNSAEEAQEAAMNWYEATYGEK